MSTQTEVETTENAVLSDEKEHLRAAHEQERAEKRKARQARRAARAERRRHQPIQLCSAFRNYCILLVVALIYTQALRSSLSAMLFAYALILPVVSLVYVIVARLTLRATAENSTTETTKMTPILIRMTVHNGSILPLPFVEAYFLTPDDRAVRCKKRRAHLTLMPRSTYTYERTVAFPYCGEYVTGISEIFVSDPLRLFRVRVSMEISKKIFVAPYRGMIAPEGHNAVSDTSTDTTTRLHGADRTEVSEIRGYRMGDAMKNIHWKLSTKTEELQVKEFGINTGKSAFLFCDPSIHFDLTQGDNATRYEDDINEYTADAVIGMSLAAAAREIENGNTCTMVWLDSRSLGGIGIRVLESKIDLDDVVRTFATVPLQKSEMSVTNLLTLIGDTQGVSVLFVTPELNATFVDQLTDASALFHQIGSNGAVAVCYVDPSSKMTDEETAQNFRASAELCTAMLAASGVRVLDSQDIL